MNTNQFTQKTMEALQRAQQIAVEYQHMQVDEEHMLLSLTEDAKALIPQLLTRCGISVDAFRAALNDALSRIPRVSGPGREADKVYISPDFEKALLEKLYVSYPSTRQLAARLQTSHTAIAHRLRKYGIGPRA